MCQSFYPVRAGFGAGEGLGRVDCGLYDMIGDLRRHMTTHGRLLADYYITIARPIRTPVAHPPVLRRPLSRRHSGPGLAPAGGGCCSRRGGSRGEGRPGRRRLRHRPVCHGSLNIGRRSLSRKVSPLPRTLMHPYTDHPSPLARHFVFPF